MNYKTQMTDPTYKILFTKKNGEDRLIECTIDKNYCEHISGKEEYVVVYDLKEQDYRTVNTDTIKVFEMI
jgi:hypothetical protein